MALLLAVLGGLVFVAWRAPAVPLVAVGGFALALVLSFPVRLLSRVMPRRLAVLVAFVALAALVVGAIWGLVPPVVDQLRALVGATPTVVGDAQRFIHDAQLEPLAARGLLPGTPDDLISSLGRDLSARAQELAGDLVGGVFGLAGRAASLGIGIFGALVAAAYMLVDARKIKAACLRAAPTRYRRDTRELWDAFGYSLSRYLGGLLFVMAVQGALSSLALLALGIPYAFALGAWVALTAVVPLVGAWVGAIPGVLVALSVSPTAALLTALVFLVIQQLEGNVLTPRVMGGVLKVHPILILLALIGAGQLAGALGILLAVPTLAVLRVLLDFLRPRVGAASEPGTS